MQLNLLQEDLFSAASEVLAPTAPKKSKTKISAVKPVAKEAAPAPIDVAPAEVAPVVEMAPPAPPAMHAAAPVAKDTPITRETLAPVTKTPAAAAEPVIPAPVAKAEPAPAALASEPVEKAPNAFKTISEVADFLGLPQHVLRFWESRFSQIKPLKLRGGRRYYRPDDIEILSTIKHLLYKQGYTINGAKKAFSHGKNAVIRDMQAQENKQDAKTQTPKISDKQKNQLANIRQELFALRETLRPFTQGA